MKLTARQVDGHPFGLLVAALMLLLLALAGQARAQAEIDPPGRVGRIATLAGPVWVFDLEEGRWTEAQRNRPVTAGDRLSTGRDGTAELRIGSTSVKLAEASEVELTRLDDERVRVHLHRGSLALRLRSREVAAETSLGTDEAWLQPQRGGLYRLDRQDDTSFAASWRGELRVEDDAGTEIEGGRRLQLWREGPQRQLRSRWMAQQDDAFAARVLAEDRDDERTASAAYVSPEMTGWEDLDRHGRWEQHPEYGAVWVPLSVRSDWAPYRQGRWAWLRPWGWTWIDEAPWGFAPFHYGRWVSWRDRWTWVPGRYVPRPVFAPALVGWIDGPGVGIGIRVGGPTFSWVPLAPWEVFRPHYRVSPGYIDRVNTPDHRWRPPRRAGDHGFGNQGVTGAVTVMPSDVLRRRPPGARDGRNDPRPPVVERDRDRERERERERDRDRERERERERERDRIRDRDRNGRRPPDEVRVTPPPPPVMPVTPPPARPQPQPDRTPPPPVTPQPPISRPQPVQPVQPTAPAPVQPPPPRRPETPPPRAPQATEAPPAKPVVPRPPPPPPPPVETRPTPPKEREPAREEPRPKPGDGRGQQR